MSVPSAQTTVRYRSDASKPAALLVVELVLLAIVFLGASAPGSIVLLVLSGAFGCFVLGVVWLALFLDTLVDRRTSPTRGALAAWFAVPILGLIGLWFVLLDAPLRARFELSRSAFEAAVAGSGPAQSAANGTVHLGLYDVEVLAEPGGTFFLTPGGGLINSYGFSYRPGMAPGDPAVSDCRELDGAWWVCILPGSD